MELNTATMHKPEIVTRARFYFPNPDPTIEGEIIRHHDDGSIDINYFTGEDSNAWKKFYADLGNDLSSFEAHITEIFERYEKAIALLINK